MDRRSGGLTRRGLLGAMVAASGTVGLALSPASQVSQLSQQEVEYQYTPNGAQRCSNCVAFRPPNACSTVEGRVASEGWCKIWSKKDA
ncbi:MAG: hypothetical protein U1E56_05425 [Bauldia sp.]